MAADMLFEVSWEVCNKVGGIFTVVKSKAAEMKEHYGDHFILIGPYFSKKAAGVFEEEMPPEELRESFDQLKQEGIECHWGTWLIKGNPTTILVDFSNYTKNKDYIKTELWNAFKIDSLYTEFHDYDEPIIWGWAVGRVLEEVKKNYADKKIVAHFHEWLTGGALLYTAYKQLHIGTVFTTHATTLGRTLASAGVDLYNALTGIQADEEAQKRGIAAKHQTEKLCAQRATVFTTVSEITAMEAEHFLGRKPDILLPNGLDLERFPTFEETSIKHKLFKNKIKEFLLAFFFPYQEFDIANVLLFFLAGRYEYHDKGIDIYIKALEKLNNRLKEENSSKYVVAFIWVPSNVKSIKPELLENKTLFADMKESVEDHLDEIRNMLLYCMLGKHDVCMETLFSEETREELKRNMMRLKRAGYPPLSTHDLYNEESDAIMQALIRSGLDNHEDDRVKAIFYPVYLSGADSLMNTNYYESIMAAHLGVFPSFYEPWGYTPLESGALGVPAITTDLSGFGRYVQEHTNGENPGIWVLNRFNKSEEETVQQLADTMFYYVNLTKRNRVENKLAARRIAEMCAWKHFITHYIQAHDQAVR